MNPVVEIGIPTFRRPDRLDRVVESALAQATADVAVRVYVVSNDPLLDLSAVRARYGIEVFHNPSNLGLVGNLNRVAELARGPYLVILHDDDELLPGGVLRGVARLAATPAAALAFSAVEIVNASGRVSRVFRPFRRDRVFPAGVGALELLRAWVPVKAPGVVWRLEALRDAGGFRESPGELVDIEAYLRTALRAPVVYGAEPGARYYFDTGNLTHAVMFRERDAGLFETVRQLLEPAV